MDRINISKKSKIILLILLIILNLILRIPSIPHEKGGDSFYIHSLSNSINSFGNADWAENWLGLFGLYPYSYASSIPFSLSGMSQLTGLDGIEMEKTILIFSVIIGLSSIFFAYILGGLIYNDFLFKYFMAFFFSISQGIMVFSTWEISTRGPFIIFLPLFLFVLLKKLNFIKSMCILVMLGIFLASTHHYFFFLIPMTIGFIILKILFKIRFLSYNINYINYLYAIILIIVFMLPFFEKSMIEAGSRYGWLIDVFVTNIRFVGTLIVFGFSGFIYLVLKRHKRFEEWYFLYCSLLFIPFIYNQRYGSFLLILCWIFFISIAFRNLLNEYVKKSNRILTLFIIILLLSFVIFSSYYNHERTGESKYYWYMSDISFETASWANEYIPDNSLGFGGGGMEEDRIIMSSNGHPFGPKVNMSKIELVEVSPFSSNFYFEGPYVEKRGTSLSGLINWLREFKDIDDSKAKGILKEYNINYFIDDRYYYNPIKNSIREKKYIFYNNGRISIWLLDNI